MVANWPHSGLARADGTKRSQAAPPHQREGNNHRGKQGIKRNPLINKLAMPTLEGHKGKSKEPAGRKKKKNKEGEVSGA